MIILYRDKLYDMFGICKQTLYYLIMTILLELLSIHIIGFDNWIQTIKKNYLFNIGSIIIYLVILQLLCFFDKDNIAWILFWITFVVNIISLMIAAGKNIPEILKNMDLENMDLENILQDNKENNKKENNKKEKK